MTAGEEAFWEWWSKVEHHQHLYTLRMAFDAGYDAKENNG
jgi:hypothetical protein